MQRAHLFELGHQTVHLPIVGQQGGRPLRPAPLYGALPPALLPAPPAEDRGGAPRLIATPEAPPLPAPACAYQACGRPAAAYAVVQLPPPATSASGQPLRIVFRRNPVCDSHRGEMAAALQVRLREALTSYFQRRALPPADWDEATWEWEPVQGGGGR
jgi:hypothetical protein